MRVITLLIIFHLFLTSICYANGSPGRLNDSSGTVGRFVPIKSSSISLIKEKVDIEVFPLYSAGKVHYIMENNGNEEKILFGFPIISFLQFKGSKTKLTNFADYSIKINGVQVPAYDETGSNISPVNQRKIFSILPFKNKNRIIKSWQLDDFHFEQWSGNNGEICNSCFSDTFFQYKVTPINFKRGKTVIDIEFIVDNFILHWDHNQWDKKIPYRTYQDGYSYFSYLLSPAKNWNGKIEKADISIKVIGYPLWGEQEFFESLPDPLPHKVVGNEYIWHFEKFEPSKDIRILMPFKFLNKYNSKRMYSNSWEIYGVLSKNTLDKFSSKIIKTDDIESIKASSEYIKSKNEPYKQYTADKLVDLDPFGTSWISGKAKQDGKGAVITITLKSPQLIHGIGIIPDQYQFSTFNTNLSSDISLISRKSPFYSIPKNIKLTTDSGITEDINLKNNPPSAYVLHKNLQIFNFKQPVKSKIFTFTITDVYPGINKAVSISEIILFKDKIDNR